MNRFRVFIFFFLGATHVWANGEENFRDCRFVLEHFIGIIEESGSISPRNEEQAVPDAVWRIFNEGQDRETRGAKIIIDIDTIVIPTTHLNPITSTPLVATATSLTKTSAARRIAVTMNIENLYHSDREALDELSMACRTSNFTFSTDTIRQHLSSLELIDSNGRPFPEVSEMIETIVKDMTLHLKFANLRQSIWLAHKAKPLDKN